jgi:allantoinase
VVNWMARRPADLAGLHAKGRIAVGADADLVAFDPYESFVVHASELFHRNPVTPYAGKQLQGVVTTTWLRGRTVPGDVPGGIFLERENE